MTRSHACLAGIAAMLSACAAPAQPPPRPEPTAVAREAQFVAVVELVNQRTREVVLRGPEGNRVTVTAGPEVRNLAQVRRGDRVVVTYGEALAVEMAPPGDGGPPVEVAAGTARARPGQRPAGAVGQRGARAGADRGGRPRHRPGRLRRAARRAARGDAARARDGRLRPAACAPATRWT